MIDLQQQDRAEIRERRHYRRTAGGQRKLQVRLGNSTTIVGGFRPAGHLPGSKERLVEKQLNADTALLQTVDQLAQPLHGFARRSNRQFAVPAMGFQRPEVPLRHFRPRQKDPLRVIYLGEISPNLYLGNAAAAGDAQTLEGRRIKTVVVLADDASEQAVAGLPGLQVVRLRYCDTRSMSLVEFRERMREAVGALTLALGAGPALLVCSRGINRSPSVAAAYAIEQGRDGAWAVDYIEQQKAVADQPAWDTLTNLRLRHLLTLYGQGFSKTGAAAPV